MRGDAIRGGVLCASPGLLSSIAVLCWSPLLPPTRLIASSAMTLSPHHSPMPATGVDTLLGGIADGVGAFGFTRVTMRSTGEAKLM